MRKKIQKFHTYFERIVKVFNIGFFIISIVFWLYLTIVSLFTEPFQLSLLWSAFNKMYGEFAFKTGCILLIVFNGLSNIRAFTSQYNDLKDEVKHATAVKNFLKKRSP